MGSLMEILLPTRLGLIYEDLNRNAADPVASSRTQTSKRFTLTLEESLFWPYHAVCRWAASCTCWHSDLEKKDNAFFTSKLLATSVLPLTDQLATDLPCKTTAERVWAGVFEKLGPEKEKKKKEIHKQSENY